MKNRTAGLLMETGVTYNKQKLHRKGYFTQLRKSPEVPDCIQPLLQIGRESIERIGRLDRTLMRTLERDPALAVRVERLQTIPCVGPVTALTWVLEVGEVSRFSSAKHAVSYCGLCSAERSSAGIQKRSPISKQRNKHLQTVLVEAAKLSQHFNAELTLLHEKALLKGNRNRATIAVARKLVAYLLAVDRRETDFREGEESTEAA
jgi:transposase